jgi:hypothetical protein
MGVRDYTAKEVLNKVLYNNTSLRTYTLSEGLNTILDAGNNRLKVNLQGGVIDGDVIVTGTLEVQGATTTIKSETILVTDKTFELAVPSSGSASDANSDGGGIILRGSTNKSILWNNANDWWNFNQGINVTGNAVFSGNVTGTFIGNVTGNASGTALTVTQASQTAITSVGTLTSLGISGAVTSTGEKLQITHATPWVCLVDSDTSNSGAIEQSGTDLYLSTSSSTGKICFRNNNSNSGRPSENGDPLLTISDGGNVEIFGSSNATLTISNAPENEIVDDEVLGRIDFGGFDSTASSDNYGTGARIEVSADGVWDNANKADSPAQMKFFVNNSDTSHEIDNAVNMKMVITSAGSVGIGNSSPSTYEVSGNNLVVGSGTGHEGMTIASGTSSNGTIQFADGASGADSYRGAIGYVHNGNYMRFDTDAVERIRITSSGTVGIGTNAPASDFGFTPLLHLKKDGDLAFVLDNATEKFEFCMNDNTDTLRIHAGAKTNIMSWDASSGKVGIGEGTPLYNLHTHSASNSNLCIDVSVADQARVLSMNDADNAYKPLKYYASSHEFLVGDSTFAGDVIVTDAIKIGSNTTSNEKYLELNATTKMYARYFGLQSANATPNLFTVSNPFVGTIECRSSHNSGDGYIRYVFVYSSNGVDFSADKTLQPYSVSAVALQRSGDTIQLASIATENYITVHITAITGSITWNS